MVAHSNNLGHHTQLQNTRIISTKFGYVDCIIWDANYIVLNPNNMNREDGFHASQGNFSATS
jgi:hypothetical protein